MSRNKAPDFVCKIIAQDGRPLRVTAKRYTTGTRLELVELARQNDLPTDNGVTLNEEDGLKLAEMIIRGCRVVRA